MSELVSHVVRRPVQIGEEVTALCGREFTVEILNPPKPICAACAAAKPEGFWYVRFVPSTERRTDFAITA